MKRGLTIAIIVVILIVVVFAAYLVSLTDEDLSVKAGCEFRPTEDYGLCEMMMGAYYDGEGCVSVSGCGSEKDEIPFQNLEECKQKCEDKEPSVGECAGVSLENRQECCDNWAEENGIAHIECVGEWTIKDNQCAWECEDKEPSVGGCAGVSLENRQECCDNWAEENGIAHIECVGEWTIKDNQCAWECGTAGLEEFCGTDAASSCESDNDCITGGCCGEICHDISLSPAMCVRCDWKDCYNTTKYGVTCGCVEGKCVWN